MRSNSGRAAVVYLELSHGPDVYSGHQAHGVGRRDQSCSVHGIFFFQAEDGIRDLTVTGVQTCALPISQGGQVPPPKKVKETDAIFANVKEVHQQAATEPETLRLSLDSKATVLIGPFSRSEERRGRERV